MHDSSDRPPKKKGLSAGCIVGIVIAAVGAILLVIVVIIAAIAVPNLLRARMQANEASAISSLRTLVSSNAMFYQGEMESDGLHDYAESLVELERAGLIDTMLGSGTKSGYVFTYEPVYKPGDDGGPSAEVEGYACYADPITPGETGRRQFFMDQDGTIRVAVGRQASASSPPAR